MATVHVSLDTSVSPPTVTCSPAHAPMNRGKDSINWKPAAHQSFTFASLTGLPNPPFSTPTVTDDLITVSDDNQNNGPEIAYPYKLCVKYNNQTYCTPDPNPKTGNGNPTVINK
ncbi:MAG: hypothetical protein EPN38_02020 [Rhodanobacteraceae bacterium]|nr:MAG: hypothetical protein EPN38_02020 [Rhodanobacteraceae bacterium]